MAKRNQKPNKKNATLKHRRKLRAQKKTQSSQKNSVSSVLPKNYTKTAKLSWLPNKTFELEFTIPWKEVKKEYQKVLEEIGKQTTIKGFRKGKAPLNLIEKNIDKTKLYNQTLQKLLPQTYLASVRQHKLKPICEPKIVPQSIQENKDWTFKATACETPTIKLGNYEEKIKSARAKEKIWVPGKGADPVGADPSVRPPVGTQHTVPAKKQKDQEKNLAEIFKILLQECQVDLSSLLIDKETNQMLARLLNEIKKLGLTLDQYLSSNQKTEAQLREEYQKRAGETLRLEFTLQKIAAEKNFTTSDKEIDQMIKAVPDEKTKKNLQTPIQRVYIGSILRKRKTIDFLLKL